MIDQPPSDPNLKPGPVSQVGDRTVNTGGGPYVERDLNTGGGDYVARDKFVFTGTPEDARRLRNRQVMVDQVYEFWIKGVLNDSLYQNVLIELNLEDKAKTVGHRPWDMVVHLTNQEDRLLPHGTRILNVYRQMAARMLILGEPGAGKTTMLLELVKELIEGRQDPLAPIPVVFNLSSWAEKQAPLEEWLVEEMSRNYNVSKNQGRDWVENDDLSLFLDGLDEVRAEVRTYCVQAINAFREHWASVEVCVCCRRQEYEALPTQLTLNGAVLLRPLTTAQVESYLDELGLAVGGLRTALHQDRNLQELAESPLMVNIMLMAYQGKEPIVVDLSNTAKERKRQLFDAYINGMFQRRVRTKLTDYAHSDTIRWLSWLGRRMVDHSQTVFLIERLQPSWGRSKLASRRIPMTAFMLMWGPIYGLIGGLIGGLIEGLSGGEGLKAGLSFWLIFGLISGLIDGFSGGMREIKPGEHSSSMWRRLRSGLYSALFWGASVGLIVGLLIGLIEGLAAGLISGLVEGLVFGLLGGTVGGVREVKVTGLSRSWDKLRTNIRFWLTTGLLVGLIGGLIGGLIFGLLLGLRYGLLYGLIFGLLGGLMGGLIGGFIFEPQLKTELPNITTTQVPNTGIKRSLKNALTIGLLFGLLFGLFFGLLFGLFLDLANGLPFELVDGLLGGLIGGLFGGMVGGIVGGGDAFFKHYILRFILWRRGHMPWNYARFLDYAAERIFLRKVGGGYIFIHRLLMEHFAELYSDDEHN